MDKIQRGKWNIKGVDRVSPFSEACPESPKTPEYKTVSLEKDLRSFFICRSNYRRAQIGFI